MSLDLDAIRARVQAGAALLDQRMPGWWTRIDLATLNLAGCWDCVLGQLNHDYHAGRLSLGLTPVQSVEHGFHAAHNRGAEWDALTDAWRDLITATRLGPCANWDTADRPCPRQAVTTVEVPGPEFGGTEPAPMCRAHADDWDGVAELVDAAFTDRPTPPYRAPDDSRPDLPWRCPDCGATWSGHHADHQCTRQTGGAS